MRVPSKHKKMTETKPVRRKPAAKPAVARTNGAAAVVVETRREHDGYSIEGGLISISDDGVLGWAWDPADPARVVTAVITHGDAVVGKGLADLFDHEIIRHRVGPGIPGFLIKLTRMPQANPPVVLTLKDEGGRTLGAPLVVDDPAKLQSFLLGSERDVYEGFVDQMRDGLLLGWAWSPSSPDRPVVVELYDGDDRIERTVASLHREDLAAAGKRDGHCGFRLELPVALLDDRVHTLKVRIANSRYDLGGGTIAFGPLSATSLFAEVAALRAEVTRLAKMVEFVASPQGEVQSSLVRILTERVAAITEIQRETIERELDALRAVAFGAAAVAAPAPVVREPDAEHVAVTPLRKVKPPS
jgi:hypothetical protein